MTRNTKLRLYYWPPLQVALGSNAAASSPAVHVAHIYITIYTRINSNESYSTVNGIPLQDLTTATIFSASFVPFELEIGVESLTRMCSTYVCMTEGSTKGYMPEIK